MIMFEGVIAWLKGVREPVGYSWDARKIPTLPAKMHRKSLEWKREAVWGVVTDLDVDYALSLKAAGWRPVVSVFGNPVCRGGLRLMWREQSVTDGARASETSQLARQIASAQRGATQISQFDTGVDLDGRTAVLATRGKSIDWGFDPYEGTGVDDALEAIAKLGKLDRDAQKVVPFPAAENSHGSGSV